MAIQPRNELLHVVQYSLGHSYLFPSYSQVNRVFGGINHLRFDMYNEGIQTENSKDKCFLLLQPYPIWTHGFREGVVYNVTVVYRWVRSEVTDLGWGPGSNMNRLLLPSPPGMQGRSSGYNIHCRTPATHTHTTSRVAIHMTPRVATHDT